MCGPAFFLLLPMRKSFLLLATAAVLCAACHNNDRPKDLIEAPQMVAFLSEAYLLEGFYAVETQYRYDAMMPEVLRAYDNLLAAHGITREAVERSFEYYAEHPEFYEPIQDSVLARLDRLSDTDTSALQQPTAEPIHLQM